MKHKIKLFIGVNTTHSAGMISVSEFDFRNYPGSHETRAFLCEQEVELDLPDFVLVEKQLEVLEKKLELEVQEAAVRQANLRQQIQELKCLTHQE